MSLRWATLACVLTACAAGQAPPPTAAGSAANLAALDHARFLWVSAQCVDGPLDLAKSGFERTLMSEVHGETLRFTYDTRLAQPNCVSTQVLGLTPLAAGQWRFEPQVEVRLPARPPCGVLDEKANDGFVQLSGDTLEELRFGSPWCRGFDARFVYRRVPNVGLDRDAIIRRYIAHWNRRDAGAVAALFSERGLLIEPFSHSGDGMPVRHEGRAGVESWLNEAFRSVPWLALQLTGIEALDDGAQSLAVWRYFDPELAEPLSGRNLFLLAGGEIFTTELQLVGDPVPAAHVERNMP
jgi:hypothetical protein